MSPEREVLSSKESPLVARKVAALGLALSLTFTATGCTVEGDSHPHPTPSFETADPELVAEAEAIQKLMDIRCEVIPDSTIDDVEELYADTWMPPLPADMEIDSSDRARLSFEKNAAIADKLGLTIYDVNSEYKNLTNDIYSDGPVLPLETYLEQAEDFMSRYSVTISFSAEKEAKLDEGAVATVEHNPLTREAFLAGDNKNSRMVLYSLITQFGELPVELVETLGLKRIVVTDIVGTITSGQTGVAGFVEPEDYDNDTIYIDQSVATGSVAIHEMVHLWDAQQCGPLGMNYDEQYSDFNPAPVEGKYNFYEDTTGYYSDQEAFKLTNEQNLYTQLQLAQTPEEDALIYAQIDAIDAKVVAIDDYGLTNIIEDKATLGARLFDPLNRWVVEKESSPVLQEKITLLAARLYEQDPRLLEYLARTSESLEDTNVLDDK